MTIDSNLPDLHQHYSHSPSSAAEADTPDTPGKTVALLPYSDYPGHPVADRLAAVEAALADTQHHPADANKSKSVTQSYVSAVSTSMANHRDR